MSELIDIIISAVDEASSTFESIVGSAEDAQSSLEGMGDSAESIPTDAITDTADAVDQVEQEADETATALDNINNIITGMAGAEVFGTMADALMDCADKAGTYQDSMMRASLEAEGAGISVNDMTDTISRLSSETGRAGGQIREAFTKSVARGITDMDSFETMMKGAGAQATLFNTDIETMGNKFSQMAMRSRLMEKGLSETGMTVEELGQAMGIQGATIDDVNEKWETLDINQRAAILGTAASMNEGEEANEAYKNSWAGLHEQIDIAKGRIERLVGSILLPVLIPAMRAAANVLNWLGGIIDSVTSGPLGGLVSAIGAVAAGIALAVPAIATITSAINILKLALGPAIAESWALLAPWLPFIAIGAAIIYVIYEIGKAFNWWHDGASMIDAISAGLQKMWNAFINHPDVQAALGVIGDALNLLIEAGTNTIGVFLEFFNVAGGGDFDVVAALINGVGNAWNTVRPAIMFVIDTWRQLISTIDQFRNGQIDLPTFIFNILTTVATAYMTIFNTIIGYVGRFASQLLQRGVSAATNFVNGIINRIRQLPSRLYSLLLQVVSRIVSAGSQWASSARTQASNVVNAAKNGLSGMASAISSALSGVVSAITGPFQQAYNQVSSIANNIKTKVQDAFNDLASLGNARGGEEADGRQSLLIGAEKTPTITSSNQEDHLTVDINNNVNLDLSGVPGHIDTNTLIAMLSDKKVLAALTSNNDFQSLDAKVKERLNLKVNRARGV